MIFADKIINLRKKNGLTQEELADKMQVSRQAVSKWESAQTVPDLDKILVLSKLFGVTTDYLLKDEIEDEKLSESADCAPVKRVSLAIANEYLEWRKRAAKYIALATFLCIVAVIPLLILCSGSTTENWAAGVGLVILLAIIAPAVAVFVSCGFKNTPFEFIDKQTFETEYGVEGYVKEKQKAYRPSYVKMNIIATCICVLSPIPLFIGSVMEKDFFIVVMLSITLLIVGIGSALFVLAGVRWASMQKLLKEGEYARRDQKKNRIKKTISTIFWLTATAMYLLWSFLTCDWHITWIVWPVAGILFAAIMCLCNLFIDRNT